MHVFPYADTYMQNVSMGNDENYLPFRAQNITDLPTFVEEMSDRMDVFKNELGAFRTNVSQGQDFNLENPVYVWKGNEVKTVAGDFLSGRAVNLIADVRHSPAPCDAIKFNEIHPHLIHEDSTDCKLNPSVRFG